ncbi:MAG: hypothetical protein JKY08_01945 [Flavobacteriaceae bacterium]|nr:hypothetical protein [Flavobacteriaceae bacterium]
MKGIKNYEYWPSYLFYIPLIPYAIYLAIKARSGGFFYAVNPGIENSGDGTESKYKTLQLIPEALKPVSIYIPRNSDTKTVLKALNDQELKYPLIMKPDLGFRGLFVSKINNIQALIAYLKKHNSLHLILQEYIDYPNECGLLFYKIPGQKKGVISSLTFKEFSAVTGNGTHSIQELILRNKRTKRYATLLFKLNAQQLTSIPEKGAVIRLNNIGNHAKGTRFINANHLISKKLTKSFQQIASQIKGWDYGRLDIKYQNFSDLEQGKNIKILEINGLISEPTHMYDSRTGNYINCLRTLKKHWKIIFTIAKAHKRHQTSHFKSFRSFIKTLIKLKHYSTSIRKITKKHDIE